MSCAAGPVASSTATLRVSDLRVEVVGGPPIVDGISLAIEPGGILGVVGESGSGKTTVSRALLGYAGEGTRIAGGSILVAGEEMVGRSQRELRRLRGRLVSYVPQDPATSLNPSMRAGTHIAEILREHRRDADAKVEVPRLLERVSLPGTREFQRRFPHQLSGGQQQRLAIAVALAGDPRLIVLDEPTTGLDVVTQARILDELDRLRRELDVAMMYVSHDLAVIAQLVDRVAVMYAGTVVEAGPVASVFATPRHPYTAGLVGSIPDHLEPRRLRGIPGVAVGISERPPGCPFAPRCTIHVPRCDEALPPLEEVDGQLVRCPEWRRRPAQVAREDVLGGGMAPPATAPLLAVDGLTVVYRTRLGTVVAASDVSFAIGVGDAVALVGESGSGKTSVARCVAGLVPPAAGTIALAGQPLEGRARSRSTDHRRRIQIVFQNPTDSLNPRRRVLDAVARPAVLLQRLGRKAAEDEARRLLERVRLPARIAERYPLELSGGERQRVAIARALAAGPELLVCDEVTSALDVSVQASVLDLLAELRRELGLALLFISHDLGVVASVCDRVLVLRDGTVREEGDVRRLLAAPADDYTRLLIDSAPRVAVA